MAKKKSEAVDAPLAHTGTVTYSMGLTIPGGAQYSSIRIDAGMTLPILPGETQEQASARVSQAVLSSFQSEGEKCVASLNELLTWQGTKNKTPGR